MNMIKAEFLDSNNHSVFTLNYRLILTTNDRKKVISKEVSERLCGIFRKISGSHKVTLNDWKYDEDYIDIAFRAYPNTELSKFINAYKSAGSRLVKKEYPDMATELIDGQFWSKTFCLLTYGEEVEEKIQAYLSL